MEISLARSTPQDVYEVEFRTLEFQVFNVTFPLFKSTVTSIPAIKYEVLTEIACPRFLHLSPISGGWFNSHFSIGFASLLVKTPKASEFLASKTCGTHSRATRFCTRRGAEKLQTIKTKQIAEVTFFFMKQHQLVDLRCLKPLMFCASHLSSFEVWRSNEIFNDVSGKNSNGSGFKS